MTTIVATLDSMAADRFVTYGPSYQGDPKIWVARGSIWGAAGSTNLCIAFKAWTLGRARRFVFEADEEDKMEALQLSADGLFLWVGGEGPDHIREGFYGIGSGGGYAVGALSEGATLERALEVAAKWDANTRLPYDIIALKDVKRRG